MKNHELDSYQTALKILVSTGIITEEIANARFIRYYNLCTRIQELEQKTYKFPHRMLTKKSRSGYNILQIAWQSFEVIRLPMHHGEVFNSLSSALDV